MIAINLLDWRNKYVSAMNNRFFVLTAAVVVACALITLSGVLIIDGMISTVKDDINYIDGEIKLVEGKMQEIKDLQDQKKLLLSRKQLIESLQASRPLIVSIFDNVVKAIPEGIVLTELTRKGTDLLINGNSDSNYSITVLMENMQKLDWVKEAKLTQISTPAGGGQIGFQMSVTIKDVIGAVNAAT